MPKRVFIGSAKDDANHLETLKKHLKLYERQNLIQIWDEGMIMPGELRQSKIEQELHSAEIILLLFSVNLLAEDFIWGNEMQQVLEKVKRRKVQLIPILLGPSGFLDTPFAAYSPVPQRDKPISNYSNKDEAWTLVVEQIKRSIQSTSNTNSSNTSTNSISNMIPQSLIDEVNNSITRSRTSDAIDAIIKWAHDHGQTQLKSDAAIFKSSLDKLRREEMLGMLSFSEAAREHAKINHGVLNLLTLPLTTSTKEIKPEHNQTFAPVSAGQLKVLMLTANPAGTTELNLNREHARIAEELQKVPEKFHLKVKRSVNQIDFQQYTENERPYVLHFSGHGEGGEDGGIIVQDEERRGESKISPEALEVLFEYLVKDVGIPINLVVLNACHSAAQAEAIAKHVPYVIGTTMAIEDDAAIAFSVGLYFQLARTNDILLSFKSGRSQAVLAGAKKPYFALYKDGMRLEA